MGLFGSVVCGVLRMCHDLTEKNVITKNTEAHTPSKANRVGRMHGGGYVLVSSVQKASAGAMYWPGISSRPKRADSARKPRKHSLRKCVRPGMYSGATTELCFVVDIGDAVRVNMSTSTVTCF